MIEVFWVSSFSTRATTTFSVNIAQFCPRPFAENERRPAKFPTTVLIVSVFVSNKITSPRGPSSPTPPIMQISLMLMKVTQGSILPQKDSPRGVNTPCDSLIICHYYTGAAVGLEVAGPSGLSYVLIGDAASINFSIENIIVSLWSRPQKTYTVSSIAQLLCPFLGTFKLAHYYQTLFWISNRSTLPVVWRL